MGSDLHLSPPSPPEWVLVEAGPKLALYTRQTDPLFGSNEVDNFHRVEFTTGSAEHLKAIKDFIHAMRPSVREVQLDFGFTLSKSLPRDWLAPDAAKRKELAELKQRVAELEEELNAPK